MKSTFKGILAALVFSLFNLSVIAQLPGSWGYNITAGNHTILLNNPNIDGLPAPTTNCWIGVFYDSLGFQACGGYQAWTGTSNAVTAWGFEVAADYDGFQPGEVFQWKIFANGMQYAATAVYNTVAFPNTDTYAGNGLSGLISLNAASALNLDAVDWLAPLTSCGLDTAEVVTVSFTNDTLGNIMVPFSVMYSIDNGVTWVTETCTQGVAPGDTVIYSFTETADFSAFATVGGNPSDTTYSVKFKVVLAGDLNPNDNQTNFTVTNMVPPSVALNGLNTQYCNYSSTAPVTLIGVPSGGTFSGTGVNGNVFIIGGVAGAPVGTHEISYTYNDVQTGCQGVASQNVTIWPVPVASISGYSSLNVCQYDTINLVGNYPGGTFSGTTFINPTTGVFNPLISGTFNIIYTYTDVHGCTDLSNNYAFVTYALPNVTINNLSRAYCANQSNIVLNGNPTGGTYFVDNVALPSNLFSPNTVSNSVHSLKYIYTDIHGCTDDYSINVKVFPLPTVSFTGLAPQYCRLDNPATLTGSPTGGSWTGTTSANIFNPITSGNFNVMYSYTQHNPYYSDTAHCLNTSSHSTIVYALPVVNLAAGYTTLPNGDIETAQPDTVKLNPGPGFISYQWNTSQTSQFIYANHDWGYLVTGYGQYVVTVTDNHTCKGIDTIFIGGTDVKMLEVINPLSNCTLSSTEPIKVRYVNNGTHTFVTGDKINFKTNINNVNTLSELKILSADFPPGAVGEYTFMAPLSNIGILHNPGTYTLFTLLKYQNGLQIPDVNLFNDTLISIIINGGLPSVDLGVDFNTALPDTVILDAGDFASFLWNTGENTQTIEINVDLMNNYCVTVTDEFGCEDEACITIYDVEELPQSYNSVSLYPNPNNGKFTLDIDSRNYSDLKYEIINSNGKVIMSENRNGIIYLKEDIDISSFAKGLYFVRINNGQDMTTLKLAIE